MEALLMDLKIVSEQLIPIVIVIVLRIFSNCFISFRKFVSPMVPDTMQSLKGSIKLVENIR